MHVFSSHLLLNPVALSRRKVPRLLQESCCLCSESAGGGWSPEDQHQAGRILTEGFPAPSRAGRASHAPYEKTCHKLVWTRISRKPSFGWGGEPGLSSPHLGFNFTSVFQPLCCVFMHFSQIKHSINIAQLFLCSFRLSL